MRRALLFALVVACCATSASAQLKIGYIDSEVLKERLPEFRDAQRTLDQLQSGLREPEPRTARLSCSSK